MAISQENIPKIENRLELFLITYNRRNLLAHTLETLLAENSPVRHCSLTVLDNCSTDGTSDLLQQFSVTYPNLIHVRHAKNIGGNANAMHAYERASKEYMWLLCDDDLYDFSTWSEVEEAMRHNTAIICVSDFCLGQRTPGELLLQLSFIPGNILRTELLTPTMLRLMYDAVPTMFPQLCPVIDAFHTGKTIYPISKGIVRFREETPNRSVSYIRGENMAELFIRQKTISWAQGFCEIISQLHDRHIAQVAFYKGILENYENLDVLIRFCAKRYANFQQMHIGLLIASQLSLSNRIYFYIIFVLKWIEYKIFPSTAKLPVNFYLTDRGVNVNILNLLKTKISPFPRKKERKKEKTSRSVRL